MDNKKSIMNQITELIINENLGEDAPAVVKLSQQALRSNHLLSKIAPTTDKEEGNEEFHSRAYEILKESNDKLEALLKEKEVTE